MIDPSTSTSQSKSQDDQTSGQSKSPEETVGGDVKAAAKDMAHTAKAAVSDRVEAAKSTAASEVDGIASALRKAADELRDDSPQARTFWQLSTGLADFSDTIRGKDFSELTRDVSTFARRNPVVFLGGAVLLGLAASRFAKASERSDKDHDGISRERGGQSSYEPHSAMSSPNDPTTYPYKTGGHD
jgi:hypothetical protein